MHTRLAGCLLVLAACLTSVAGCASTTDVLGTATNGLDGDVVKNTGTFPTFATPLNAANSQMTDDEAAQMGAELEALAQDKRGSSISEAEYKRRILQMRKLAATHADEAAKEIAN